ncbi:RecE family exodeoxyribonuclease [Klebsiella sp. WP8-S18-ESBL-06]|uniref:RecE family exodeoxyribonuclease n=1 Tax=Klebsiella sp. WP8-S18-ESBL-06 TaxID=2675726 RepID=UPI0015DC9B24|nr:RecE family exodeoxyribonuclease [Klebsiella sp. WP8-S18-ESBL-06]BBT71138.1 exodeoxyribonuclease [Klebsiella sp. WP8-S18-ESBL-06]
MEFFHVVKATQKSGKKDAVIWFSAKSEARANLQLDVELEDAGIETGRGKDYMKPVRTDFPVFNDLPEESTVDLTWCERYELADDQRTWQLKEGAAPQDSFHQEGVADSALTTELMAEENGDRKVEFSEDENAAFQLVTMPFRIQILAQLCAEEGHVYHISIPRRKELSALELDTDNTYAQNLLLAVENCPEVKAFDMPTLWKLTDAVQKALPQIQRHELNHFIQFVKAWVSTEYIDRGLLVKEWQKGNRVAQIQRTDVKTNAGGGNKTDRNPELIHTLDTLDIDIALATLTMDFNIYDIPGGVYRRAKEIISKKQSPFKEWSETLRKCAGILDYSRAAIFALIRGAAENAHHFPVSLQTYINANLTETDHEHPTEETMAAAGHVPEKSWENEINEKVAAEKKAAAEQPKIGNVGGGIFSVEGLMNAPEKQTEETTSDEPMEETECAEGEDNDAVSAGKSAVEDDPQADSVTEASAGEILAAAAPSLANDTAPDVTTEEPQPAPDAEYPAFFEPGRYEGLPNEVYHAANGISSTQVKDVRVSLMYFNARHVAKTIVKERSPVLDMGNLVHALALQPEQLDAEFSVEPVIPEGAFTTTATIRAFIDEHNANLPPQLSADDIKALLEEHNATLPPQVPLGASLEETGQSYMSLPAEFQRIEADQKQTAAAMKACIKEYNATLPPQVKTSGSRDALLEQLAIINPDLVAQEAQKPQPLKVSGTKADLIQAVKSVNPGAVFADELLDAWRENPEGKVLVTRQQLSTALNIQTALLQHPTAGKLLTHPSRAVEVSYFGFDDETGLEVRVRPDLEIDLDGVRVGADLKTISMWNVKQEGLRARLHREIIDRDYHLSAAMYCETAALDQFFWIFVNKDENYHWIAIIEASTELLELGMLEYRKAMRAIATGFDTGEWPAPITGDYTDELNDFDLRRLEALRLA